MAELKVGEDEVYKDGEPVATDADVDELESKVKKWKSRSLYLSVFFFLLGIAVSIALGMLI